MYVKQLWVDEVTPADAEHMNHLEDGLEAVANFGALPVIDVTKPPYGALGTYNTSTGLGSNDTVAIAAAVAAAAATPGGAIVYFPPSTGYYRTSASIVLPTGVFLMGAGRTSWNSASGSRIYCSAAVPLVKNADQVNGNDAIGVIGLRLYGNGGGTVNVIDFRGSGVNYCHAVLITDNMIEGGSGSGVYLDCVMESDVTRNFVLNVHGHALDLELLQDSTIEGNSLTTNTTDGGHAIYLHNGAHNILRGNYGFLASNGLRMLGATRNVVVGNRFNTNRLDGIYICSFNSGAGGVTMYNTISGNVCYDNGTALIGTRAGIALDGDPDHNIIYGNVCTRSPSSGPQSQITGLRVTNQSFKNLVFGNMCAGNQTTPGLKVDSTGYNTVFGNHVDALEGVNAYVGTTSGLAAPTYSASITPDAGAADWQTITVTNATAFAINAPTNPPDSAHTQKLVIEIFNSSGGAMGAITWDAAFVLVGGAFTNPLSTKKRFIRFEWNGSKWVETGRAGADY